MRSRMIAEAEAEKTTDRGRGLQGSRPAAGPKATPSAMRIYADAFGADAPFYKFLRTPAGLRGGAWTSGPRCSCRPAPRCSEMLRNDGAADAPGIGPGAPARRPRGQTWRPTTPGPAEVAR